MAKYVIEYVGVASRPNVPKPQRTMYLQSYDPFGDPPGEMPYRTGESKWTTDLAKAMQFDSHEAALEFWQQVHPTEPTRPDGKPNRPLTALTIVISPLHLAGKA